MIESFASYLDLISLTKSEHTLSSYRYDVGKFLDYLTAKGVKRITSFKSTHITAYLNSFEGSKKGTTLHRYFMSIKSYCKWLKKQKLTPEDLAEELSPPKSRREVPDIPTQGDIAKLMEMPDTSDEMGVRDRAILEVLYSSGLRASELCDLGIEDFADNQLLVRCGKRDKVRSVPLTQSAIYWIGQYIILRGIDEGYLFVTCTGNRINRGGLSKSIRRYAKKAGLGHMTAHSLRHSCATHLLEGGADILLIQKVLGHQSVATTQIYAHMTSKSIHEQFNKFHPRRVNDER